MSEDSCPTFSPPPVSVVIAARNVADTIDEQLAALRDQNYPGPVEIIVADNGSTDATCARVRAWSDAFAQLRIVDASATPGAAYARNVGIAAAVNELVVTCDADDIVDSRWMGKLVGALADHDLVTGGVVPWDGGPLPEAPRPFTMSRAGFGFLPILSTGCLGLRRSVWDALGRFDEQLPTCEDVDFAWRAQLRGYTLALRSDAFIYYRVTDEPFASFRKAYAYGRFQPVLYRRYHRAGLPRQPLHRALGRWCILAATIYHLAGTDEQRVKWCNEFGRRCGRLVGSIEARAAYL